MALPFHCVRIAAPNTEAIPSVISHKQVRIVAVSAGIILCAISLYRPQISTIATILLLYITFEYVLLTRENLAVTQKNLDLFKRQLERQERVFLHFDLMCKNFSLFLRVSNLGLANFLLQMVHVRKMEGTEINYEVHTIIESGKTEVLAIPDDLCGNDDICPDLEFRLSYRGLDGGGESAPKCFNVLVGLQNRPAEVKEGLDGLWSLRCPKCKCPACTDVHGLKSFEAAEARRKQLREDLDVSCPDHKSQWLLTVDAVESQRKERLNRHKL